MTKEQYDKLQPYEQELRYAVRMSFMSMPNSRFNELHTIYKEIYGTALNKAHINCSTCRLRALQRMGNDFYAFQQELAKEEAEKRKVEEQPKKKVGRPKKIDLDAEQ